jgi:hypothetical protein
MAGARRIVEEERLIGCDRLGVLDELQRLVGDVIGQVVALGGRARLGNGVIVIDQVWLPLVVACVSATSTSTVRPASSKPTLPRSARPLSAKVVVVLGGRWWCSVGHGWEPHFPV